jgi:hypothetical protein
MDYDSAGNNLWAASFVNQEAGFIGYVTPGIIYTFGKDYGNFSHGYSVSKLNFNITTEVANSFFNNDNIIFQPNPFKDKLNISDKRKEFVEITLFDITSRKILQQKFTNSVSLSTEQLAKGLYLYEVRDKNGLCKKGKVVKD